MRILLGLIAACVAVQRPGRFHFLQKNALRDASETSSTSSTSRSVTGMCSMIQDSIGSVSSAASSGIKSLTECAQFAKDSSGTKAVYASFSSSVDTCAWFADCQCLASSSTCLGGDSWNSIAVADAFTAVPSDTIQMVPQTNSAESAVVVTDSSVTTTPSSSTLAPQTEFPDEYECDYTSSNLMQSFQSKCEMNETMSFTRLIAALTLLGVLLFVGSCFGLAYYFELQDTSI